MSENEWYRSARRRRRSQLSGSKGVTTGRKLESSASLSGVRAMLGATQSAPVLAMAAISALLATGAAVEAITVADTIAVGAWLAVFARENNRIFAVDEFPHITFAAVMRGIEVSADEATKLRRGVGPRDL